MSKDAMQQALEAMERYQVKRQDFDRFADEIIALQKALAEQPAQQEPKIDIYRSFAQWKRGNVLEHGVPRTEHYSEAQLDLVEMGWNYGYDAGRAVEQALDKKAENARELGLDYEPAQQEPVAWMVYTKDGQSVYVTDNSTAIQADQRALALYTAPPAQRPWVGLTDEEVEEVWHRVEASDFRDVVQPFARAIEAKLKEKNT